MSNMSPYAGSIPYVLDNTHGKEQVWDLWSRLNKDRLIFLGENVTAHISNIIVAQLLYMESTNKTEPIYLYINSNGGEVVGGLAIYDTMQYIAPPVHTICYGAACSMAAVLLAAGEPGYRYCLPNATVMIHQPSGGSMGSVSDIEIQTKRIKKLKKDLTKIMEKHTKKDYETLAKDMDRDFFMTAVEAKRYGIVDQTLTKREE